MSSEDFSRYLQWIKDNGGSYSHIEFKDGCVYSTNIIKEDDKFVTVPFSICITEAKARKALPEFKKFSSKAVLSFFLALERRLGEKSFYWPYINILPKKIMTPLYFDEKDFQFIQNTNLASGTKERRQGLYAEYIQILDVLPPAINRNDVSWDDFLWAYTIYTSRSFPYRLIDPTCTEASEALFPLVDSLNHRPHTKITWYRHGDIENGTLSFVSGQVYQPGEEIFNNYGPKSNEELLLGYGFCFEYNEYDHIALKPNFSRDHNHQTKIAIIKQCNLYSGNVDPFTFYIHRNNLPKLFLKVMRVLVMNELETQYYANCSDSRLLDFVGYRNEISMLTMTVNLLKSRLHNLKSVTFPQTDTLKDWHRYALMYRAGQEDVLNITIRKIEDMKSSLAQQMAQDIKENKIGHDAPFLSIINNQHRPEDSLELDSTPFLSLDSVLITVKKLLSKNPKLSRVASSLFEDIDSEEDMIMMLGLIRERSKADSEWKLFFDKVASSSDMETEPDDDILELYESMLIPLYESFPEIFDLRIYTIDSFTWANHILNNYSIDNPFAIVPL